MRHIIRTQEPKPACLNPVADYLPISKIENGIIYTKDHRYVKVVEVVPINFMLRSAQEQRNIIYSFVSYPAFFSSREVKEMGIDTTKIRSSRSTGILLAPSGIFVTYNSSSALMKWRYKSEMRVKALIWSVICQQRLSPQFRHEDVHGLILGNSMDLAYQILTSTGGRKHDFFMLDGSYEHFLYLTNDHQGEVILALLCDPGKTAELDRILLQGLTARQPGLAIEHDGISPDGSPVLFGYFCDLPRIARFNTSLELSERPGTLICFDFQAEVLHSYCGSRMRFQTIDFTKFEGRLFP